jgi:hypothetical protein
MTHNVYVNSVMAVGCGAQRRSKGIMLISAELWGGGGRL